MWELREAVVRKSWDTLLNMVLILTPKTIMGYVCEHTSKYICTGELSFVSSVPRSQGLVLYPSFIYSVDSLQTLKLLVVCAHKNLVQ